MNYYFIDRQKSLIGKVENGKIFSLESFEKEDVFGNIYRGRVDDIVGTLNCAFINIGLEKGGYLSLNELLVRSGEIQVKKGGDLLVQVKKSPVGSKGAALTLDYSIKGKYLVLLPNQKKIYYSDKITSKKERKRLGNIVEKLNSNMGFIVRTNGIGASEEDIVKEFESLFEDAKYIEGEKNFLPTPKLLYENNKIKGYFLDNYHEDLPIYCNDKDLVKYLNAMKCVNGKVTYNEDYSISYNSSLNMDYESLFKNEVKLSDGGNIVIEKTQAATIIDVNSADANMGENFEDYIYKVNCKAAQEVARQVRLRNISGIIIVDFINMKTEEKKKGLLEVLETELKKDKRSPILYGYTALGLVEINRKRQGAAIDI